MELFYDPRRACKTEFDWPKKEPEMTEFESAFLCGLVKEKKPSKIVEVGVAGGGTTAIVLRCLSMLKIENTAEIYSVDLAETFYRGRGERTGYLADELLSTGHFNHHFLLGKTLAEVLESIGDGIDFVILDTAHNTPGEILDFIAILPYLKDQACVVLHDISFNLIGRSPLGFATQLLLSCVVADKIIVNDDNRKYGYPNIGAFRITDDTRKYIENVLDSLLVTWKYVPPVNQFQAYRMIYKKHYGEDFAKMFETIYNLQKDSNKYLLWNRKPYKFLRTVFNLPKRITSILHQL